MSSLLDDRRPSDKGRVQTHLCCRASFLDFISPHTPYRFQLGALEPVSTVEAEEEAESEAEAEAETEAEAEAEVGADGASLQAMTAVEKSKEAHRRNQKRRIHDANPTSKWCGICLKDRQVKYFAKRNGGAGALFARARHCNTCVSRVSTEAQAAVR
jgi:hypothetical protein